MNENNLPTDIMHIKSIKLLQSANQPIYLCWNKQDFNFLSLKGCYAVDISEADQHGELLAGYILEKIKFAFNTHGFVILDSNKLLDRDRQTNDKLVDEMKRTNTPYLRQDLTQNKNSIKDFIESDSKHGELLITNDEKFLYFTEKQVLEKSAHNLVNQFRANVMSENFTVKLTTGYKKIDAVLNGGLYSGLYTLVAGTGIGKTTFCLQIADAIARQGIDVLYFSLEMDSTELIAKSISRITFEQSKSNTKALRTRDILLQGQKPLTPEQQKLFNSALIDYANNISKHIYFYTKGDNEECINVEFIEKTIKEHILNTGRTPLVVVDYFQLLAKTERQIQERMTEQQIADDNSRKLKTISRKESCNCCILSISATARSNYNSEIGIDGAKNSGSIEYTSNCVLSLQYAGMEVIADEKQSERQARIREKIQHYDDISERNGKVPIQLKLSKDRFGARKKTDLFLWSSFGYFSE